MENKINNELCFFVILLDCNRCVVCWSTQVLHMMAIEPNQNSERLMLESAIGRGSIDVCANNSTIAVLKTDARLLIKTMWFTQ